MILVSPFEPMARITGPDEPGQESRSWEEAAIEHFQWVTGLGDKAAVQVNSRTALTYSVFWACVRIISQTIAALGWHQFERKEDGKSRIEIMDDVSWLLQMESNPEMDSLNFRQVMLKDALVGGNGIAEIERDGMGRPRWLWRLSPERVELDRTDSGQLVYVVDNGAGVKDAVLLPNQVFHLRGLTVDGLVGYSMVDIARRYIEMGLSLSDFGSTFFQRGPTPGGILEMPGHVKQEERDKVRKSFEATYGGSKNAGRVVAISGGMKFTPLSMSNSDAQFNETGNLSALDICRIFGIPPHKVAELSRATFSNVEQQEIGFVQDAIFPWCRRLEVEADIKLFGRTNRGRRFTKLNIKALLRGDSKTQTEMITKKVTTGVLTVNEAREFDDLNPIDGGDTPLIQGAMVPLERVLKEPAPQQAALPAPAPVEPEEDDGNDEAAAAAFEPLLIEAYSRLLRVAADKARRAAKSGKLAEHLEAYCGPEGEQSAAKQLEPYFRALLAAFGRDESASGRLASEAAARYVGHIRADVRSLEDEGVAEREAAESMALMVGVVRPRRPAAVPITVVVNNMPEQQAPIANVHVAPAEVKVENIVNVPEQPAPVANVNIAPAEVKVENVFNTPEQKPADVKVENVVKVPKQKAPVVNVLPQPARGKVRKTVNRDAQNNISEVIEEEIDRAD